MNERANIFARIDEALKSKAHPPGHGEQTIRRPITREDRRGVMPLVPEPPGERIAMFAERSAELKTDFRIVADEKALATGLRQIATAGSWKRIAAHGTEWVRTHAGALGLPVLFTDGGYDKTELEQCDAGITECDALVAQTGSVVVTSRNAGGRALSVFPPHHVVLARREQMAADLPAAFQLLRQRYQGDFPSMISFVTGPSRTGDIERILVLGAHGPKQLTVFLV